MQHPSDHACGRRGRRLLAAGAAATLLGLATLTQVGTGPAGAVPVPYVADSTSGAIIIKEGGGADERTITDPPAHIEATIDDQTGVLAGNLTFGDVYTDTFQPDPQAPDLRAYVKVELTELAPLAGTVTNGAVAATSQMKLALVIFVQEHPTEQHPESDARISDPATCFVTVDLDWEGTHDPVAGLVLTDPQFDIALPNPPGFPSPGCDPATGILNQRIPGPNNSVTLAFPGEGVEETTTTTSTSTTTTSTSSPTVPLDPAPNDESCAEARAAGVAPIRRGDPGYRIELDSDRDGVACEDAAHLPRDPRNPGSGVGSGHYGRELARTGDGSGRQAALGTGLLAVGGALLLAARRHRAA